MQMVTSELCLKIVLSDKRNNNHGAFSRTDFAVILAKLTFSVSSVDLRLVCIPNGKIQIFACCMRNVFANRAVPTGTATSGAKFVDLELCLLSKIFLSFICNFRVFDIAFHRLFRVYICG